MKSVIGAKGQVVIPKPLRDSLGLYPGARLEFREESGCLIAQPVAMHQDPIRALVGLLPPIDVDAALEASRGPVWNQATDGPRPRRRGRQAPAGDRRDHRP